MNLGGLFIRKFWLNNVRVWSQVYTREMKYVQNVNCDSLSSVEMH